jgi:hypothetical protein
MADQPTKKEPKYWASFPEKNEVHPVYAAFEEHAGIWCPQFNGHFRIGFNLFETEGAAWKTVANYWKGEASHYEKHLREVAARLVSLRYYLEKNDLD